MLYPELLKTDFDKLPPALRRLHSGQGLRRASGTVSVRHASGPLARMVGFPPAGDDIPLRLEVAADGNREVWVRNFGDRTRRSVQGCHNSLLVEHAGPLRVEFQVTAEIDGLHFQSRRASLWGLPIPVNIEAFERGSGEGWEFEVSVAHVGWYGGTMELLS